MGKARTPRLSAVVWLALAGPCIAGEPPITFRDVAPDAGEFRDVVTERKLASGRGDVQALPAEAEAIGWDVAVQAGSLSWADLDLALFARDPRRDPFAAPGCRGRATGPLEVCRILETDGEPGFWASVAWAQAKGGGGVYSMRARPLHGPRMGETSFVARDSRPLATGPAVNAGFQFGEFSYAAAHQHLWRVTSPSRTSAASFVVRVSSPVALAMALFDEDGREIERPGGAQSHELRLDLPGGGIRYVLVGLERPSDVFQKPQYIIALRDATESILLRPGETVSSGREETYRLLLERGQLALLTFESSGFRLEADGDPSRVLMTEGPGSHQLGFLGSPLEGSGILRSTLNEPLEVTLRVKEAGPTRRYVRGEKTWTLNVLESNQPSGLLLPFRPDVAIPFEDVFGNVVVPIVRPPLGAVRILRRGSAADPPALEARILRVRTEDDAERDYDLALCNRLGEVLAISDEFIDSDWPSDFPDLYIVVFPAPHSAGVAGDQVELEILPSRRALTGD